MGITSSVTMEAAMFRRIIRRCFKVAIFSWDLELSLKLRKQDIKKNAIRTTLVVLPLAVLYYGIVNDTMAPHEFQDSECFGCHFTIPKEGDPRPFRFVAPIDSLCLACHTQLDPVSHYVNASTSDSYEAVYPVIEAEEMSCSTCHDPHMPFKDISTGERTYFLREGVTGKEECLRCHTDDVQMGKRFSLLPVMNKAHGVAYFTAVTSVVLDYSGRRLHIRDKLVVLDRLSVFCLNCHDSPDNPELTNPGSEVFAHGSDNGLSHPVGIDYDEAAWRNKELRGGDMDTRILLFDGKVGCCSCHDPYSPGGIELRIGGMTNYTDLCMGCHIR